MFVSSISSVNPYAQSFKQQPAQQTLKLGGDMRLIAKEVQWGDKNLDDVVRAIQEELKDPKINPVRLGKLNWLKQLLKIDDKSVEKAV